jgi:NADPH-dependent 2,4-dienoyl-CoA reductase/sulfur reductase-like enzyme
MKEQAVDILVVGGGPAGLAAAASAAQSGARVGLVDDNPDVGGQIWRGGLVNARDGQARRWLRHASPISIQILTGTRVVASPRPGVLLAENATEALALRYERLILAPGARELFLPFPGWTLPGVMGAGGLQALVKGGLPIAGKRVVIAGSGPLLPAVAAYLRGKGAQVLLVAEQAPWRRVAAFSQHVLLDRAKAWQAARFGLALRGVPFRADSWVIRAEGEGKLERVILRLGTGRWSGACDYLGCGFGLLPNVELPALLGCAVVEGAMRVDTWQRSSVEHVYGAGEVTGIGGLEKSLVEGQIAGFAAAGQRQQALSWIPARNTAHQFATALQHAFSIRADLRSLPVGNTLVCRCEDVRYGDLARYTSWRSAKLQTRCGMGPCQGRVCGAATAFLFGWAHEHTRPPVTPARLGSLAAGDVLQQDQAQAG